MSSNPGMSGWPEASSLSVLPPQSAVGAKWDGHPSIHPGVTSIDKTHVPQEMLPLSAWSKSVWKRALDVACVLCSLPLTVPLFLTIGLAVRVSSQGPVLFRQQRMGRNGRPFTILKFRTMPVRRHATKRPSVTTSINQRFTPVGPFLRRWKLDELPQLINVLSGDMSIVGPRPKLADHQTARLNCRPGITGRATIVFAREEMVLSPLPSGQLDGIYHKVVLPLKQHLDEEYMAKATFASDMKLIFNSVFRNWEHLELRHLIQMHPEFVAPVRRQAEKPIPLPVVLTHQQTPLHSEFQAD
jgi:lipopolysaccharide/colanic/teichoic acid biosynthesis glycosyltransferase